VYVFVYVSFFYWVYKDRYYGCVMVKGKQNVPSQSRNISLLESKDEERMFVGLVSDEGEGSEEDILMSDSVSLFDRV
jgi:hypothetical protein